MILPPQIAVPTTLPDGGPLRAEPYDAVVVGGGIIGCSVALYLRGLFPSVLLLEREGDLLRRASLNNQARVHNGYHYPRSLLTGLRSRVNFPRFVEDFADCVDSSFDKYYAIATSFSKVTGDQFATFCRRIGAPASPAPREIRALFSRHLIDDVFRVREYAFDADRLRALLHSRLDAAGVEIRYNAMATAVRRAGDLLSLELEQEGARRTAAGPRVFNCTYSSLNELLRRSGLPLIPLKHELTEIALVSVPPPLAQIGLTVMCGPFFSVMPFPVRSLHSFTHVRYTPHESWEDRRDGAMPIDAASARLDPPRSSFPRMLLDAQRYVPLLAETVYRDSLWETKTVLPSSEMDDSRPILFRVDHGLPGLTCILGGKIDNIYDVIAELEAARLDGRMR